MIDWTHWHNEPLLVGALVLAAWLYALAVGPWRFRIAPTTRFPRAAAARFACGLIAFYLAVGSPLDQVGERFLFCAHMLQHMVIVYLAAALLITGTPGWLLDAALRPRPLRAGLRLPTRPVVAAVLYALCLSAWHVPAFYDAALRNKPLHIVQHLMFFGVAVLMWWPLLTPSRVLPRLAPGAQILYLVGVGGLQMPLVAALSFSREVFYPTYQFAPRLTVLTPREDQILGGALMGVGSMFVTLGILTWCFYCWYRQSEAPASPLAARP